MQIIRTCKECGVEYPIDIEDNIPICHSCYLKLYDPNYNYIIEEYDNEKQ